MSDQSAWLRRAFELYHGGKLTLAELLRMIRGR